MYFGAIFKIFLEKIDYYVYIIVLYNNVEINNYLFDIILVKLYVYGAVESIFTLQKLLILTFQIVKYTVHKSLIFYIMTMNKCLSKVNESDKRQ